MHWVEADGYVIGKAEIETGDRWVFRAGRGFGEVQVWNLLLCDSGRQLGGNMHLLAGHDVSSEVSCIIPNAEQDS